MSVYLVSRVLAAIETVEQAAKAAPSGPWIIDRGKNDYGVLILHETPTGPDDHVIYDACDDDETVRAFEHVVLHDPTTVLRRCAADRRIVVRHSTTALIAEPQPDGDVVFVDECDACMEPAPCPDFRDIAEGYGIEVGT